MKKKHPTQKYLNEIFKYIDGVIYWKRRPLSHFKSDRAMRAWHTRNLGRAAGSIHGNTGYLRTTITFDGVTREYRNNRIIWTMFNGSWPEFFIDHINHDSTDNRIENLRDVDNGENLRNKRKSPRNKSGVTGVYKNKDNGKWHAQIFIDGKSSHIGFYEDLEDARKARKLAEIENNYHENHGVNL